MFDNGEIAKRAIERASQLKVEKKKLRSRIRKGVMMSVSAFAAVIALVYTPGVSETPAPTFILEDTAIPLGNAPSVNIQTEPPTDIYRTPCMEEPPTDIYRTPCNDIDKCCPRCGNEIIDEEVCLCLA